MSRAAKGLTLVCALALVGIASVWLLSLKPSVELMHLASTDPQQTWRPVVLMPWINYGADFGGVPAWHMPGVGSDERVDQWLGALERSNTKAVVWFLFADGRGALEFEASGMVTRVVPSFWKSYDRVLASLAKHHLQVIWVLVDYEIGMASQTANGAKIFGHADLIEDATKRRSFIANGLIPVLQHRPGAAQVAGWVLINEPEHLLRSGYVTEDGLSAFIQDAAKEIRKECPQQPIAIADANIPGLIELSQKELDFLVFHHYAASLPPPEKLLSDYLRLPRPKPIYIGEFDIAHPPGGDLTNFVRAARALGYAGAWPWSLTNRIDDSQKVAADTQPQFDLLLSTRAVWLRRV
jgi:hypothetical protein